jgi:hypothetical protein
LHDGHIIAVFGNAFHKGAVDLEAIQWKALQVNQAGITGAVIIQCQTDAHFDPADGAFFPQCSRHADRNLLQQRIARRMTQGIIDGFETVQIQKQHGQDFLMAVRMYDGMIQAIHDKSPVRQPCQGIVIGKVLDMRLLFLAGSDILGSADDTIDLAGVIPNRESARMNVAQTAPVSCVGFVILLYFPVSHRAWNGLLIQ